jgi:hypothetical protein
MTRHYGVACQTADCETVIVFAQVIETLPKAEIEFPVPPLKSLGCPICHRGYQYGSDDVVEVAYIEPLQSVVGRQK